MDGRTCPACGSPRIHKAQDFPHGVIVWRCRNCRHILGRA